jgi:hypothetical protein
MRWIAKGLSFAALWFAFAAGAVTRPAPVPFTLATWHTVVTQKTPTLLVFTALDCAYCPAVIATAQRWRAEHRVAALRLEAVVMDGGYEEVSPLAANDPFRTVDVLAYFDAVPAALREAVDPTWRGETPFTALVANGHVVQTFRGPIQNGDLDRTWARRAGH